MIDPISICSLIDSHCHLDFSQFDPDREEILQQCSAAQINQLIIPGVSPQQWESALQLSRQHPALHAAIGVHPLFIEGAGQSDLDTLNTLLTGNSEIIAVGEVGLDHFPKSVDRAQQRALLISQIEIATHHQRPLLLHIRKAHQEVIELLRNHPHCGGIVHAFSGSLEQARLYIDMGFLIGVGGVVTRPNAHKLHRTVREIPVGSIALETDAPDLPPIWAKGERNTPLQLPRIAQVVADLRNESFEEIACHTTNNVKSLFNL